MGRAAPKQSPSPPSASPASHLKSPCPLPHHQLPSIPNRGYFEQESPPPPSSLLWTSWAVSTLVSLSAVSLLHLFCPQEPDR